MRFSLKIIIFALLLMLIGGAIFVIAITKDDFVYESYDINADLTNISIDTSLADIEILPSEGDSASLLCYLASGAAPTVTQNGGNLQIELPDTRKWYEQIYFGFRQPKLTLYIPAGEYGELFVNAKTGNLQVADAFLFSSAKIENSTGSVSLFSSVSGDVSVKLSTGSIKITAASMNNIALTVSTGDITLSGVKTGNIALTTTTGDITLTDVTATGDISASLSTGDADLTRVSCKNLTTSASTGDAELEGVIATEKMTITRTTGDVEFEGADAAEITVETDTGSVTGSLLSPKIFIPRSSTGDIILPETTTGGICKITTCTGDIEITIGND